MADGFSGTTDGRLSAGPSQSRAASVNGSTFGSYANLHQGDQNIGQSNFLVYNDYGAWPPPQTGSNATFGSHGDQPNGSCWTVPFGRNKDFVGRESILDWLLKLIPPDTDKDDCQMTAIKGLGGVGKTQVALEAAFRVRGKYRDCHVFWVPAVDATAFENAYREIGQELAIQGINDDKADVKLLVKSALSRTADKWLLIIDNADDVDLLYSNTKGTPLIDSLPFNHKGSILFTTRNDEVSQKLDIRRENIVHLTEMSRSEAVDMLQKGLSARQIGNTQSTASLLDFLADLPLAIKQASAYMVKTGIGVTQYLEYCRSSDECLIELLSKDFEDRARYKTTQNPVATTWLISFTAISRDKPLAARYLQFMSFLAQKDIPKHLLPLGDNLLEAYEAIGMLKAYAFISERADEGTYDIHRLVRLVMQNWLSKEGELKACVTAVMQQLGTVFPDPEYENRNVWARYLPHVLTAVKFQTHSSDKIATSRLLIHIAKSVYMLGKYKEAEQIYRQQLELDIETLGAEHPNTLCGMDGLANALTSQGQYEEGEKMQQQTLRSLIKTLGAEHPCTLSTMNNLAFTLTQQGWYNEAEKMHRQVLKLRIKIQGTEHIDTLISMSNLAHTLYMQYRYNEAEKMHRQVFKLCIEILGAEHPNTLASINNLANTFNGQRKYKEAENMQQQTLKLCVKILGAEHPNTLTIISNLASILNNQGKYEEAEKMHQQALKLQIKVLGAEHPDTLRSRNNLALPKERSNLARAGDIMFD